MTDQRSNGWFAKELERKCEDAEAFGRNWTFGVIGDSGYPAEIVLTTSDAREIARRLFLSNVAEP